MCNSRNLHKFKMATILKMNLSTSVPLKRNKCITAKVKSMGREGIEAHLNVLRDGNRVQQTAKKINYLEADRHFRRLLCFLS